MADHLTSQLSRGLAFAGTIAVLLMLGACSKPATSGAPPVPMPPRAVGTLVSHLQQLTKASNATTVTSTDQLKTAVDQFLSKPDEHTRQAMQQAWLKAHNAFAATRALLIADHHKLVFDIDAWPIEPGFIDSLPKYPESGIINDFTLQITKETLRQQNGITDAEEVCLGFHPLEYYAFSRPMRDFIVDDSGGLQAKVVQRRRRALTLMASMLDDSVRELTRAMTADLMSFSPDNDRNTASDDRLVRQIISGSRQLANQQKREAGLIVDRDAGHARFSHTSAATLLQQIRTERRIYAQDGDLMKILKGLDGKTTDNLATTLSRLEATLASKKPSPRDRAQLPLMFSALEHQFDDLQRRLPTPGS